MSNGISTSKLAMRESTQKVADALTGVTSKVKETPLWKKIAGVAVPLLTSLALPGFGTALSSWGLGLSSKAGSMLPYLGKFADWFGKGLQVSKGGKDVSSILHGLTTKIPTQMLVGKTTRDLLSGGDKSSMINLESLSPKHQAYGRRAVKQFQSDYKDAFKQKKDTGTMADIMSGVYSQFGTTEVPKIFDMLKDAFGVGWKAPIPILRGLGEPGTGGRAAVQYPRLQRGGLITDARKRFVPRASIANGLLNRKI